jgi:hypothetical protein
LEFANRLAQHIAVGDDDATEGDPPLSARDEVFAAALADQLAQIDRARRAMSSPGRSSRWITVGIGCGMGSSAVPDTGEKR